MDDRNDVSGSRLIEQVHQPFGVRLAAHIISVIFHPLFIPVYVCLFLMYWHPLIFAGIAEQGKIRIIASIVVNLTLLPAAVVFLLWKLKFADNMLLKTQKERIIPYAAVMFFAFWAWNVFRNIPSAPPLFVNFLLGVFIAVILSWMANIYFKVSMHGVGVGGMLMFTLLVSFNADGATGQYLAVALLITGLVCTARLVVSDHKPGDVYVGVFIGVFAQWLAYVL